MTFTLVVATQAQPNAAKTLSTLRGFGEKFDEILYVGWPTILDAYREGLRKAKEELVVFCHDDVTFLTAGIEETFREAFERTSAGLIGLSGSTLPLACGCVYHSPDHAVGSVVSGVRGSQPDAVAWNGAIVAGSSPRRDVLGLMKEVELLDAGIFATMTKDWKWEGSSRETFFSGYDAEISYEAKAAGASRYVLPLPIIHYSAQPSGEAVRERDEYFLAGITEEMIERWKPWTVPCYYGGPDRWCRANPNRPR